MIKGKKKGIEDTELLNQESVNLEKKKTPKDIK